MSEPLHLDPDSLAPQAANPSVRDVMRDEVVFCLPSTPIDAVAKLMADNDLMEIPVLIDRRPVGYIASRDIIERYVDGGVEIGGSDVVRPRTTDLLARDLLRQPPLLADEATRFDEVVAVMSTQGRTVALIMHDDERPIGMLSVREIAAHAARALAAGEVA